jgi:hypothetical protein
MKPHVSPLAILPAPLWRGLPAILARALGDEAQAVNADLARGDFALKLRVKPAHEVNLSRERVKAEPVARLDEQPQLGVGSALRDRVFQQVNLLA